jgi:ABC-type proline/glycine betaine transport system ATPase subunit
MTMVVVTHEIKVADRVVFTDEGRIIELGSPQEVIDQRNSNVLNHFFVLSGRKALRNSRMCSHGAARSSKVVWS